MYYRLTPELAEIEPSQVDGASLTAGYIEQDELESAIARFGFWDTSAKECLEERDNYRNTIEVYEDYTFGLVNIVNAQDVYANSDRLAFFIKKNLLLVTSLRDEDGSTRQAFLNALRRYKPASVTLEKLLFAFMDQTINRDGVELDKIERHISALEELIAENQTEHQLSGIIYKLKKKLLILRGYYEQLIDIGEELEENENDIFENESLHYFALLTAKAERLSGSVSMLCDELNQLRDAYQATMDYRLNETMKLLTIITIVCLPLTLIVGWYGMNFPNMYLPNTEIGYPVVIGACVLIMTTVLIIFKRKGLL